MNEIKNRNLPTISWNPDQSENDQSIYQVKGETIEGGKRRFSLQRKEVECDYCTATISDFGTCFQRWMVKKEKGDWAEVRMFSLEGNKSSYFVVANLRYEEIGIYQEDLSSSERREIIYRKDPDIHQYFLTLWFKSGHMPNNLGWDEIPSSVRSSWQRSNASSEVGITRITDGRIPAVERILRGVSTTFSGDEQDEFKEEESTDKIPGWALRDTALIVETKMKNAPPTHKVRIIFNRFLRSEDAECGPQAIAHLLNNPQIEFISDYQHVGNAYRVSFYEKRSRHQFFAERDLKTIELSEISRHITDNCLVHRTRGPDGSIQTISAAFLQRSLDIRVGPYIFGGKVLIEDVIQIEFDHTGLEKIWSWLKDFVTALLDPTDEEISAYGSNVDSEEIKQYLFPAAGNLVENEDDGAEQRARKAILQMNRACARKQKVILAISPDRIHAEVRVVGDPNLGIRWKKLEKIQAQAALQSREFA